MVDLRAPHLTAGDDDVLDAEASFTRAIRGRGPGRARWSPEPTGGCLRRVEDREQEPLGRLHLRGDARLQVDVGNDPAGRGSGASTHLAADRRLSLEDPPEVPGRQTEARRVPVPAKIHTLPGLAELRDPPKTVDLCAPTDDEFPTVVLGRGRGGPIGPLTRDEDLPAQRELHLLAFPGSSEPLVAGAHRTSALLTGTPSKRRPQLLVGKRKEPTIEQCVMALVQEVLLEEYLETGILYAHALAGQTYLGTRGLYAPKGVKPDRGPYKFSIYRMNNQDFGIIATAAIKACRRAGLEIKDRDLRAQIVTMYHTGVEAGEYQAPIYPPRDAMRTTQVGDHPLDFRLPRKPWVPKHLQGQIIRAGGTHKGQPIKLGPMLPKPAYRSMVHRQPPKTFSRQPRRDAPPTDWIFNSNR